MATQSRAPPDLEATNTGSIKFLKHIRCLIESPRPRSIMFCDPWAAIDHVLKLGSSIADDSLDLPRPRSLILAAGTSPRLPNAISPMNTLPRTLVETRHPPFSRDRSTFFWHNFFKAFRKWSIVTFMTYFMSYPSISTHLATRASQFLTPQRETPTALNDS
jgi:hypothetical protein